MTCAPGILLAVVSGMGGAVPGGVRWRGVGWGRAAPLCAAHLRCVWRAQHGCVVCRSGPLKAARRPAELHGLPENETATARSGLAEWGWLWVNVLVSVLRTVRGFRPKLQ